MMRNPLDTMIGGASIPMLHNDVVSGDAAASTRRLSRCSSGCAKPGALASSRM